MSIASCFRRAPRFHVLICPMTAWLTSSLPSSRGPEHGAGHTVAAVGINSTSEFALDSELSSMY